MINKYYVNMALYLERDLKFVFGCDFRSFAACELLWSGGQRLFVIEWIVVISDVHGCGSYHMGEVK